MSPARAMRTSLKPQKRGWREGSLHGSLVLSNPRNEAGVRALYMVASSSQNPRNDVGARALYMVASPSQTQERGWREGSLHGSLVLSDPRNEVGARALYMVA